MCEVSLSAALSYSKWSEQWSHDRRISSLITPSPTRCQQLSKEGYWLARQATFPVSIEQSRKPHPTNAHLSGRQAALMHQRGPKTLRGLWTCSTCSVAAEGATFVGSGNQRSWRFCLFVFVVSAYSQKLMWWIGFCGCYVCIFNFSQTCLTKPLHQSLCYFSI